MSPIIGSFSSGSAFGRKGGLPPSNQTYPFTTATFTSGGVTGRSGPDLTQARNGLTSPTKADWANNTTYFNTSGGYQLWECPGDGVYRIEVAGARGGFNNTGTYGQGAIIRTDFTFVKGTKFRLLVGQPGNGNTTTNCDTGSGGGTFFALDTGTLNTNVPIIVAGGGGGASYNTSGKQAVYTSNGGQGDANTPGGTNGQGGSASGSGQSGSSGGGGFYGNGSTNSWGVNGVGFVNGGQGGPTASDNNIYGGFGGGGGGHGNCYIGSGGGGGYSGGGGGGYQGDVRGGGGGSFNTTSYSATNRVNVGYNSGSGYIKIDFLG